MCVYEESHFAVIILIQLIPCQSFSREVLAAISHHSHRHDPIAQNAIAWSSDRLLHI